MSKGSKQQILKTVTQITKQKCFYYPYYPVSAKFEEDGNLFVFSVEYPVDVACITFFMITKDYIKKTGITSIQLAGINDKSYISTIQIIDFKYKVATTNVWGLQGTILVGYRQGHLVIIKFKDKKTEVVYKYNKSTKKQGFLSKATSYISSDQPYKTMFRGPIKKALYSPSKRYAISFLVGNNLVLYKNKQESCQQVVQKQYRQLINEQQKHQKDHIKIVKEEGIIFRVENTEICTYHYTQKQQILVVYSMDSTVVSYSSKDMSVLYSIKNNMPIRKISYFASQEANFLIIMPYQDYALIVDLNKRVFSKIMGHRCFVANSLVYKNQINQLVYLSGGMDHRLCFDKIQDIKTWHMISNSKQSDKFNKSMGNKQTAFQINDDQKGNQFSNRYSLGQYQNARTNNHDYGFSDLMIGINGLIVCPTYDGKIKVFSLNYK